MSMGPDFCDLSTTLAFINLTARFRDEILLDLPSDSVPPNSLPSSVADLLAHVLCLEPSLITTLWLATKDTVWSFSGPLPTLTPITMEQISAYPGNFGVPKCHRLAYAMFYPPFRNCQKCGSRLREREHYEAIYFTLDNLEQGLPGGAHSAYCTSTYCRECQIRYYPNYSIKAIKEPIPHYVQTYYGGIPTFLHSDEHTFISTPLSNIFAEQMSTAWVSATNNANIFNNHYSLTPDLRLAAGDWSRYSFALSTEQVWHAFDLLSLLIDQHERNCVLSVAHGGSQDNRLKGAMELRNAQLQKEGYEEWDHACSGCTKISGNEADPKERSWIRSVVTDGVGLGHPCCAIHNCPNPLINNRHCFCAAHAEYKNQCAVTNCERVVAQGKRTCDLEDHIAIEAEYTAKGKAFFTLHERLCAQGIHAPDDSNSIDEKPLLVDDHDEIPIRVSESTSKSELGNRQPKARFGRCRTHNEQLVVACCGIIIVRATMFGAESLSGVKEFLKNVYPKKEFLPHVIWYDDNCGFQRHLNMQNDLYFSHCCLPIDLFHFKAKHKTSDTFCQQHCNPALWPQLHDGQGNWLFNSSAAEQANAWIGGFLAIVREMLPHRFTFFMDEMIKRRNRVIVRRLRAKGLAPWHIPFYKACI